MLTAGTRTRPLRPPVTNMLSKLSLLRSSLKSFLLLGALWLASKFQSVFLFPTRFELVVAADQGHGVEGVRGVPALQAMLRRQPTRWRLRRVGCGVGVGEVPLLLPPDDEWLLDADDYWEGREGWVRVFER